MKKNILAFLMLLCVISSYAQNDSIARNNYGKNEIKLNALFLLIGAFEPSYERNLTQESSIGMSVFIPFDKENFDSDINYYVSPYYRIFFGKKYAAGFFLEGFGMLNSTKGRSSEFVNGFDPAIIVREDDVTDFALGFGLGGKWMTTGGFVFEVNGGFGRNLFNTERNEYDFVGKFGFNLGYRF